MKILSIIFCGLFFSANAHSQSNKQINQSALMKTNSLLTNKEARAKATSKSQAAFDADVNARALTGSPDNLEEIYRISADVMKEIVSQTGGDPKKMQDLLMEAQSNPNAFYKKLGMKTKGDIKKLEQEMSKGASTKPSR